MAELQREPIVTTLSILLSDEDVAAIDSMVGSEARDAFVAEAAGYELRRRRMLEFLSHRHVVMKDEDHPEFADGSAAWVHRLRAGEDV